MNEREEIAELAELATIINDSAVARGEGWVIFGEHAAEDVLAAGYRKPRTITTAEELDALPYGSVVLDAGRATATKLDADYWEVAGFASHFRVEAIDMPAIVLYEPEAQK